MALLILIATLAGRLALAAVFPLPHLLLSLAVLTGYALFVLVRPERDCRRCNGWGNKHNRRRSTCGRCGGTGTRFRLGAPLVHRGAALVIRYVREWRAER